MSACAKQTFNSVTPDAWNCLVNKAASHGITISGPSGQATKDGFTVAWNYDSTAQNLTLQCTDSPFWAPCSMINGKIHDLVEGCL
ncbi:MAG: hypothetical protein H7A46_09170 [Verrucomicrobiales bacterium]|nr:hypothetical protein [Verrucomicrobiales bacterium]